MKNIMKTCFILAMTVSCASAQKKIKTTPFDKLNLSNGVQLYFIEDKSLPHFTIQAVLSEGSAKDPESKSGAGAMAMSMLKEGSGSYNSQDFKSAYSKYSSEFNVEIEKDLVQFQSEGLTKYSAEIVKLFLDTIFYPHFIRADKSIVSLKEFSKVKEKRLAQIEKMVEDASYYSNLAFNAQLFKNSSYAMPEYGTKESVKSLKLKDVQEFYNRNVKPENIQIAMTGNFSNKTKELLISYLKVLKSPEIKNPESKTITQAEPLKPRVIVIDKPNLKQAEVRIGHFGVKRNSESYAPLFIANSAVGSGDFNSLLMQEIRVKRGLVYGIRSQFNGLKDQGSFVIAGSTRFDKVEELIQTTLDIIKKVKAEGLTSEHLEIQKGILVGQFPMKFETHDNFLNQIMKYKVYGLPDDYIQIFYNTINSLGLKEANQVLQDNYKPDDTLIVIFAAKKQLPLSFKKAFKTAEYIDFKSVF